jgi:hypothetical protein
MFFAYAFSLCKKALHFISMNMLLDTIEILYLNDLDFWRCIYQQRQTILSKHTNSFAIIFFDNAHKCISDTYLIK